MLIEDLCESMSGCRPLLEMLRVDLFCAIVCSSLKCWTPKEVNPFKEQPNRGRFVTDSLAMVDTMLIAN